MSEETPKRRFLNVIVEAVSAFEKVTGVEVFSIKFERIQTNNAGDPFKTTIVGVGLELR